MTTTAPATILCDAAHDSQAGVLPLKLPNVRSLRTLYRSNSAQIAAAHREVWHRKPILREIYAEFYERMASRFSAIVGPTIEIGGGPGTLRTYLPDVISSDIVPTPWLSFAGDACRLPIATSCAANVVMVDVLHHLPYPQRFLAEVTRVLAPHGRLIILEPYLSPMSWPLFRFLHPEPASLLIRPLDREPDEPLFDPTSPWNSDQGVARAIFWKQLDQFEQSFPELRLIDRECLSTLLWPLSGGFTQRNRIPAFAKSFLRRVDRLLERAGRLSAYRCLITLERREEKA